MTGCPTERCGRSTELIAAASACCCSAARPAKPPRWLRRPRSRRYRERSAAEQSSGMEVTSSSGAGRGRSSSPPGRPGPRWLDHTHLRGSTGVPARPPSHSVPGGTRSRTPDPESSSIERSSRPPVDAGQRAGRRRQDLRAATAQTDVRGRRACSSRSGLADRRLRRGAPNSSPPRLGAGDEVEDRIDTAAHGPSPALRRMAASAGSRAASHTPQRSTDEHASTTMLHGQQPTPPTCRSRHRRAAAPTEPRDGQILARGPPCQRRRACSPA